ncbi:hypothetical protein D1BOALGB6SA_2474 [Olavius sp. associated proteobacterium Delta 1]|nr:hypothetical protein D1BOALGB6SA_2474 [Olavius sp. associated proteobacterium Delta 1]
MLTFFKGLDDFDLRYEEIKRKAKEEAEIKACKEWEEFEATFNYIKKTMDEIENRRQNTPTYWER